MRVTATCITAPSRRISEARCRRPRPRARLWLRRGDLGRSHGGSLRASHDGGGRAQCARRAQARATRAIRKSRCSRPTRRQRCRPARSISLCMHSVAQYLSAAEFDRLLEIFRALVKPDGLVVIGDIVPPQLGRAGRRVRAVALCYRQRFLLGGGRRLDADFRVGLSAPEEEPTASRTTPKPQCWSGLKPSAIRRHARRAISATIPGA